MQHSKLPHFFLALAAVLATAALVMLVRGLAVKPDAPSAPDQPDARAVASSGGPTAPPTSTIPPRRRVLPPTPPGPDAGSAGANNPAAPPPPHPATPAAPPPPSKPDELVKQVAKALAAGDRAALDRLLGKDALDPQSAQRLQEWLAKGLRLRPQDPVREIGELEVNARSRWSIELDGQQPGAGILLELRRDGPHWRIDKLTLPAPAEPAPGESVQPDALGVADAFLQATLRQNFEVARGVVDTGTVSDAKIAGICILFEEGGYRLRQARALRAMFLRDDTAGFLVNVEAADGNQNAQFSLTMKQSPAGQNRWLVAEINLDELLVDYAKRVAGGDVYYSPLVKNPAGGDTLALYFEFDADEMNPRTQRQLEIVSRILKADTGKKLTLSGHTDALGTAAYNNSLSSRRAKVVADFLTAAGVDPQQIHTVAKGASQPRRPNLTESGEDNPEGRRANRRTEIYLDF